MYFYNLLRDMVESDGKKRFDGCTDIINMGHKNIEKYNECSTNLIQLIYLVLVHHIALKTGCRTLRKKSLDLCKDWLDRNILPNGCLYECMVYDSLDFQVESLLILSFILREEPWLFTYKTKYEGSIRKSLQLLIPYASRQKLHICYLHSQTPSMARVWDCKEAQLLLTIYQTILEKKFFVFN